MRWMYDAAYPPTAAQAPHWHVAAGYIGGDTPHVWTRQEWDAQWAPCRLPIFTATGRPDTPAAAHEDAAEILARLGELGVPHGSSVVLDTETQLYGVYLQTLDNLLHGARYPLINYGSLSFVVRNPETRGGRWAADWTGWTGELEMAPGPGIVATQLAGNVVRNGATIDESVISALVPLWKR